MKFQTETESEKEPTPIVKHKPPSLHVEPNHNRVKLAIRAVVLLVVYILVLIGHFYCALFVIWSASYFWKETIQLSRVVTKDQQIAFHWVDWYWYLVGFYVCIPYAFNRNKINTIESKTIHFWLYQYHSLISQIVIYFGIAITIMKLNRGYIKYQLRRQMWSFVALGYVFMISTVQIYNLYQGYIFVLCPLICVRFNSWIKNYHAYKTKALKDYYLPRNDPIGFIIALVATGVCAFIISGVMCHY